MGTLVSDSHHLLIGRLESLPYGSSAGRKACPTVHRQAGKPALRLIGRPESLPYGSSAGWKACPTAHRQAGKPALRFIGRLESLPYGSSAGRKACPTAHRQAGKPALRFIGRLESLPYGSSAGRKACPTLANLATVPLRLSNWSADLDPVPLPLPDDRPCAASPADTAARAPTHPGHCVARRRGPLASR